MVEGMSKQDNDYEAALRTLQIALVKYEKWAIATGAKALVIFEGRDGAGKDGTIRRINDHLASRNTRVVSLPKPSDRQRSQWYFQRYIRHLPGAGELVMFNRSWYNRAGVEPVMGFCTPLEHEDFLRDVPSLERMLEGSGIRLGKIWLDISKTQQSKRLQALGLLRLGDVQPDLHQPDAGAFEHALQRGDVAQKVLMLERGAKTHHRLDTGAVVPGAVEHHQFAGPRQMADVALEIPLRALSVRGLGQGDHAGVARRQMIVDPPDGSVLARPVAALEDHQRLGARGDGPLLILHQGDLQRAQGRFVVIVLFGHAFNHSPLTRPRARRSGAARLAPGGERD